MFWEELVSGTPQIGCFRNLKDQIIELSHHKYIFYDQKIFFLQNEYIFKKDLCFIYNTNIFCIKKYFSNEIYIFYIFIYIFLCKKSFFSVKTFLNTKLFFYIKTFFSGNNVYFVKKHKYLFKKKILFFNLVLQQMNNHIRMTVGSV